MHVSVFWFHINIALAFVSNFNAEFMGTLILMQRMVMRTILCICVLLPLLSLDVTVKCKWAFIFVADLIAPLPLTLTTICNEVAAR